MAYTGRWTGQLACGLMEAGQSAPIRSATRYGRVGGFGLDKQI